MVELIFDILLDSFPFYNIFKMFLVIMFVSPLTNGYYVVFQCIITPLLKKREDQIETNLASCLQNVKSMLIKSSLLAISSLNDENTNDNIVINNENEFKAKEYKKYRRWSFDSETSFKEVEIEQSLGKTENQNFERRRHYKSHHNIHRDNSYQNPYEYQLQAQNFREFNKCRNSNHSREESIDAMEYDWQRDRRYWKSLYEDTNSSRYGYDQRDCGERMTYSNPRDVRFSSLLPHNSRNYYNENCDYRYSYSNSRTGYLSRNYQNYY